jgi:site-specific DNA-methyltransferase (adenine-specific)
MDAFLLAIPSLGLDAAVSGVELGLCARDCCAVEGGMKARTIGSVNLFQGDCMEFMRSVPDQAYDLAIVDPPYFNGPNKTGYYGKGYSSLGVQRAKHYDSLPVWDVPDAEYFRQLARVSKHQIIWGANHFCDIADFSGPGWIVWDKLNGESSFADAELAHSSFDKAVRVFRYVWNGMHQGKYGGNKALNEARIHPTQKPVALYEWLLSKYAAPGQKILDTHLGSASSAIAALNMGFQMDGVELDPSMYSAGSSRVASHHLKLQANPSLLEAA